MKPPVMVRPATASDLGFIFNSWLNSYKESAYGGKYQTKPVFFANHKPIVQAIVASADALVACNPDEHDQIFGYIVFNRPNVVHYTYVKHSFRKFGIAKTLFQHAVDISKPVEITHITEFYELVKKNHRDLFITYNPYLTKELVA